MSVLTKLTTVTAVSVLVFAVYYGSYKVPDGTKITSRLFIMMSEAITDLYMLSDYLGFGDPVLRFREMAKSMKTPVPEGLETQDFVFDGVPVRVYTPKKASPGGAGVIYFHGGGWVIGTLDMYNRMVGDIANTTELVMVSVGYRLAPEHKFPAPFHDCVKATLYFLTHSTEFGVDPTRVAVAGDSAGGNLAAAVALKLGSQLKAQALIYPALQAFNFDTPSYQVTGAKGLLLRKSMMVTFWLYYAKGNRDNLKETMANNHTPIAIKQSISKSYVNIDSMAVKYIPADYIRPKFNLHDGNLELWQELQGTLLNPFFAPLAAPDVSTVPQALILTAEYDVLRDDGILYAQKLEQAGVKVSHYHSWDGNHGMLSIPGRENCLSVEKMFHFMCDFLKDSL